MVQLQPASEEQQQKARRLLELASLDRDDEPMMQQQQPDDAGSPRRRRRNAPERSVSFNRDVHVKRIAGRSPSPASLTTALAGDGVGTFVTFPLRKESARQLSREDLAEEAARVLEQADSVDCVARTEHESRKYASLPGRGSRKSKERRDQQSGSSSDLGGGHSKPKKKALGRSVSDATDATAIRTSSISQVPILPASSSRRYNRSPQYQGSSPDRSLPELEEESQYQQIGQQQPRRRGPPLQRSSSDLRKQPPPPLTPIIESSPHPATADRSFRFEQSSTTSPPPPRPVEPRVKTIPIYVEGENRLYCGAGQQEDIDVVDGDMLHRSSRYDHHPQQQRDDSTIHKMIHRLSNDRSPPPQLTRTMVAPSPGFAHNNNRPFSYTRPSDITSDQHQQPQQPHVVTVVRPQSPTTLAADCIYAQVQMDKKKSALQAQRSHSDSDEGLGLERKDSSRENSPADKEAFHRNGGGGSQYYLDSELQRHNDINSYKSSTTTTRFGDNDSANRRAQSSERFIGGDNTTVLDRGRADGMADAARRRVNGVDELSSRVINERPPSLNKSSDLSARRDLLESRIKMFSTKGSNGASSNKLLSPAGKKLVEPEPIIVDKPIVPSPVVPSATPKRYLDTYISETRTNSNGEKYIFEKEIHDENGKVYGFEKITNKVTNGLAELPLKPKQGYVLETRTDKYGDKYIVETRNYNAEPSSAAFERLTNDVAATARLDNSVVGAGKKDDVLRSAKRSELYQPRAKKNFEALRHGGYSKSTQRLNELSSSSESPRGVKDSRYVTRSYENLASSSSAAAAANARDLGPRRPGLRRQRLGALREGPLDDYDTDISQATNSQLDSSKFYKETRTMQRYRARGLHDDYDSSPPRHHRNTNGYNSSRYDSDTTTRDSVVRGGYHRKGTSDPDEPKKPLRRSRNHLDYAHLDERNEGSRALFDEGPLPPQRPPRHNARAEHHHRALGRSSHHHHQVRTETRLSDSERKDRLADSGIENDYRPRDSHEADGRHGGAESEEDDSFVTAQFLKQERRHTDRSMPLGYSDKKQRSGAGSGYDKYVMYYNDSQPPLTAKPPLGLVDAKKYEKKAAKKSGGGGSSTMSKVRELFRKKEKKTTKEDKFGGGGVGGLLLKRSGRAASTGALTDDEVTVRYREYRGDQLRSARSARDLESEINEDEYRQRRRLSTPNGSPSPVRPSRLSRSTGTLARPEHQYREMKINGRSEPPVQESSGRGWFKSLTRKNKTNAKTIDKKSRIPESEILTTGTEDEEASSAPERASVQKNLRFFGDTDQESISSSRDRRNKRGDNHHHSKTLGNSNRHPMGMSLPPRKTSRLAESALSSGESTTGDSSQQSQNSQRSQRSVVYLHAATVGEIPGPNERRRAASREELNRPLAAHTRTVSRSVSVLAPWRPRHYREPYEINYDQQQYAKPLRRRQRSRETLSRRAKETRRGSKDANTTSKSSTINRSTLKSKDKQKVSRTVSTESLASKSRNVSSRPELSRSTSVPRDPNKSAGWFKLKSKKSRA